MDTLALTISLLLIAGVLALVLYPLWTQNRTNVRLDAAGRDLVETQARYQAALAAIRDLMFDHEMGKVATDDYQTLLVKAKLEAAHLRRQIDWLSQGDLALDPALDARLEALVAQTRQTEPNGSSTLRRQVEAEIEALKQSATLACPHCGKLYQSGDMFCAGCGQAIPAAQPLSTCPQCGHTIQPDDAFCARCGSALPKTISTRKE